MGSCEDPVSRQNTHDQIELGLMYPKPDPDPDPDAELLVQQFENVALKDTEETEIQYPLRPYAQDCPYYVRTGSCKFGLNCKFNHPVTRTGQVFPQFCKICLAAVCDVFVLMFFEGWQGEGK